MESSTAGKLRRSALSAPLHGDGDYLLLALQMLTATRVAPIDHQVIPSSSVQRTAMHLGSLAHPEPTRYLRLDALLPQLELPQQGMDTTVQLEQLQW